MTGQRTSVLLVEDEPLISLLFEEILEETEFDLVASLLCNRDALEWLGQNRPDLAIVDYRLSDGPCFPIILALRTAGIPILLSSGHDRFNDPELVGLQYLIKPFRDEDLVKQLRDIVGTKR
jgi:DNA-binding response OmpR family regulator